MGRLVPLLASVFGLLYQQELKTLALAMTDTDVLAAPEAALRAGFIKVYMALLLISGLVAWWLVGLHRLRNPMPIKCWLRNQRLKQSLIGKALILALGMACNLFSLQVLRRCLIVWWACPAQVRFWAH